MLNADDLGSFWSQLSAANGRDSDGTVLAVMSSGSAPEEGESITITQDTSALENEIDQLRLTQAELQQQLRASEIARVSA